ncbi:uncharacterized protein LOC117328400 [Pecten maximus]|uniref:uncharacterized protein LOC117328400 n=1 Tax=Pecten maximus TaxID=6579 RepID=UPI001458D636|nr:uncharacterized protein LOC117328400 [Pecten maximus]
MATPGDVSTSLDEKSLKTTNANPVNKITVITMNVSGPYAGDDSARSRRKCISDVVWANNPHILLIQEFRWKGIRRKIWENTPLPDRYTYTGNTEASIIYDTERLCLEEPAKLQTILEELKRKREISEDFSPLARSCIRVWKTDAFKVLVVSWHGVHSRINNEEKKTQFRDLQVYLKKLSKEKEAAILLGGDFNINISLIRSLVFENFTLYEYKPSERRSGKVIDYFITSSELDLTDVRYIDLVKRKEDETTKDPHDVLDHDPVSAIVSSSTEEKTSKCSGHATASTSREELDLSIAQGSSIGIDEDKASLEDSSSRKKDETGIRITLVAEDEGEPQCSRTAATSPREDHSTAAGNEEEVTCKPTDKTNLKLTDMMELHLQRLILNIGGTSFETSVTTLQQDPQGLLAKMVLKNSPMKPYNEDKHHKSYFIDRDSKHFPSILNYLRYIGQGVTARVLPSDNIDLEELLIEVKFFELHGLEKLVEQRLRERGGTTRDAD